MQKLTAVQSIIEHYEKLSKQGSNQAYVITKFIKNNFLELEKQQIMDAYEIGYSSGYIDIGKSDEQYYNETYKSK